MAKKKLSLRARAILPVSVFLLATNIALGTALTWQSRRAMKTQINERMLDIVNTAAAMLDGDVLERLTAEDAGTPEYQDVLSTLIRFRDNIKLDYIYYVRHEGDKVFTFGIDPDPIAPGAFGSPVVYTDALYAASQGVASVDAEPYEDAWGRFYSAFSPVFDSQGKVAAVITADFAASWYEAQLNQNARTIILACALSVGLGIAIALYLIRKYSRRMEAMESNLGDLAGDIGELTGEQAQSAVDANGRVAVEMFRKSAVGDYAAILMDVRMPEMDGLEATAAIRALDRPDAKRIPIIALTANAFDEDVQRSMQAGMNAHLSKPVESSRLIQTLGELIYAAEQDQEQK